jgi:single-strand DNA-binding protein
MMADQTSQEMMANLNRVTITGYLVRDPTPRSLPSGQSVCDMRIACHRRRQEQLTGSGVQWVEYCDARIIGRFALIALQRLQQGSGVAIEGRLSTQPSCCENPEHRVGMFVLARKVQFLEALPGSEAPPRSDGPLESDAPPRSDAPQRAAKIDAPLSGDAPIDAPPKRRARFSYGSIDAS